MNFWTVLKVLMLGGTFLLFVLLVQGCGTIKPDALTAALVHQSVPFKGPGPAPFGDNERSFESTLDGLQLGAEWGGDKFFGDFNVIYATDTSFMRGDPWHVTMRAGYRLRLP